jgi:hypothetical protein
MLCQFDNWCVTCARVLLECTYTNASNAGTAVGHPARMATEVPISTCCPIPTGPFGGLDITAAVHMSGRDLCLSKSGAQARLNSRLTVSTRPDRAWVDCSGVKRRKRKVAALGGMKRPKIARSSRSKVEASSTPKRGGCTM